MYKFVSPRWLHLQEQCSTEAVFRQTQLQQSWGRLNRPHFFSFVYIDLYIYQPLGSCWFDTCMYVWRFPGGGGRQLHSLQLGRHFLQTLIKGGGRRTHSVPALLLVSELTEFYWAKRDEVGTALWSHVRVVVVPPTCPPPTGLTPPGPALHCYVMDGRGRLAFTLTKRTCF